MAQYVTINSNQFEELIEALSGGGGGSNVNDVQVNGVSVVDNHIANIKTHKILTLAEFNALSSTERDNGIIYLVTPNSPTNYNYYTAENDTIIIRENTLTSELLCFFCGYNNITGSDNIPQSIASFIPSQYNGASQNYTDSTGVAQNGWGGFNNDLIKLWTQDWSALTSGVMWGVVDLSISGQQNQPYVNPYDTLTGEFFIYCRGHKFSSYNI